MRSPLLAVVLTLAACRPSYEDVEARARAEEAAAKERARQAGARRAEERKAQETTLASRSQAQSERAAAERAERAAVIASMRGTYAQMTPADREKALREIWVVGYVPQSAAHRPHFTHPDTIGS